jgi:hypothetical protein
MRRVARKVRRTAPVPQPTVAPVIHHDSSSPKWRGYLPEDGQLAAARCGCTGPVARASRLHGGSVSILIRVACPSGHPIPGVSGLEHVVAGAVAHFFADQIQPEQPAVDAPDTVQERTAA